MMRFPEHLSTSHTSTDISRNAWTVTLGDELGHLPRTHSTSQITREHTSGISTVVKLFRRKILNIGILRSDF